MIKLSGERFVVRQHERRAAALLDELGHRERLARPGDAQQDLMLLAVLYPADQSLDRCRLITGRLIVDDEAEGHTFSIKGAGRRTVRESIELAFEAF